MQAQKVLDTSKFSFGLRSYQRDGVRLGTWIGDLAAIVRR